MSWQPSTKTMRARNASWIIRGGSLESLSLNIKNRPRNLRAPQSLAKSFEMLLHEWRMKYSEISVGDLATVTFVPTGILKASWSRRFPRSATNLRFSCRSCLLDSHGNNSGWVCQKTTSTRPKSRSNISGRRSGPTLRQRMRSKMP